MEEKEKNFDKAIQALKNAGTQVNSDYYQTEYDLLYTGSGLWELVKEAEAIGGKLEQKMIELKKKEEDGE
jgi:hypothetical protein